VGLDGHGCHRLSVNLILIQKSTFLFSFDDWSNLYYYFRDRISYQVHNPVILTLSCSQETVVTEFLFCCFPNTSIYVRKVPSNRNASCSSSLLHTIQYHFAISFHALFWIYLYNWCDPTSREYILWQKCNIALLSPVLNSGLWWNKYKHKQLTLQFSLSH
jgi:hypothetical protein